MAPKRREFALRFAAGAVPRGPVTQRLGGVQRMVEEHGAEAELPGVQGRGRLAERLTDGDELCDPGGDACCNETWRPRRQTRCVTKTLLFLVRLLRRRLLRLQGSRNPGAEEKDKGS